MLSKRDVQIVRIAVRWKWFTPEQGEDVLFLKRKFGSKLTIEEVIRRRQYLDDDEIEQLGEAANQLVGRRPAVRRAAPRAESTMLAPDYEDRPREEPVKVIRSQRPKRAADPPPVPKIIDRAPTRVELREDEITDPRDRPGGGDTEWMVRVEPSTGQRQGLRPALTAWERPDETEDVFENPPVHGAAPVSTDFDDDAGKTVVTSIEEILAKQRERLRAKSMIQQPVVQKPPPPPQKPPVLPKAPIQDPFSDDRTAVADPRQIEELRARLHSRARIQPEPTLYDPASFEDDAPLVVPAPEEVVEPLPYDAIEPNEETHGPDADDEEEEQLEGSIGPYEIVRLIARGSRGALYRTKAPDGSDAAVKVIDEKVAARPGFLQRMHAEATRAAQIQSPHVVRVLDVGLIGTRPYLAMQYVDAWTLEERLDSGDRPSLAESLVIGRDVARALEAAEAANVVHGEVNASNVLVGRGGEAYLTGFALAKDSNLLGDLYGLGATLHALVTGNAFEAAAQVPSNVAVIDRLVARDPGQRFGRAAEVVRAFDEAIAALELAAPKKAEARADRVLIFRAGVASAAIAALMILVPAVLRALDVFGSRAAMHGALAGAIASIAALMLLAALGLVRRGELPLPASSQWLVRVQDGAGAAGAALLVAGIAMAPPSILNVVVAAAAIALLGSWLYGILLRRDIAFKRPDRGVGRILAVLGDPSLARWRLVHVPMLATLAMLATARFAFLAYFASH